MIARKGKKVLLKYKGVNLADAWPANLVSEHGQIKARGWPKEDLDENNQRIYENMTFSSQTWTKGI